MENEYTEIIPSFKKTIFNASNVDLVKDYGEIAFDMFLKDGLLKDIPLINTALGMKNTVLAIRDRHFIKKTMIFTQQMHDGTISKEKIEKHKRILESNQSKMEREMETVIIYLDKHIHYIKNSILGNFYCAYIDDEQDFDWEDFELFADILDRVSIYDLPELKELCEQEVFTENDKYNSVSLSRLNGLGLVQYANGMVMGYADDIDKEGAYGKRFLARISIIGKVFCEIGLKNIK